MFGMNVAVALLALLIAGPTTVPAEDEAKSQELSQEGWKLWQGGRAAEAEERFVEAVQTDPTNAPAWNGLGWSRMHQMKRKEAAQAFQKCVEVEPEGGAAQAALNGLGWIHFQDRDYAAAEKSWVQSEAPAGWIGLAQVYLLQGKWDEAAKWAQKCLDAPGGDGSGLAKEVLAAAKNQELADDLRRRIEPPVQGPASATVDQGWQLFQQGRFDEAREKFEQAIEADPQNMSAHNGLGFSLLNTGDGDAAKEHFQICLEANPKDAAPMNGMAQCLRREGKVDEAIELWKQMQEMYPGVNAGTYELAFTYLQLEKYEEALPYLEKLAKHQPDNEQVAEALEQAKRELGR